MACAPAPEPSAPRIAEAETLAEQVIASATIREHIVGGSVGNVLAEYCPAFDFDGARFEGDADAVAARAVAAGELPPGTPSAEVLAAANAEAIGRGFAFLALRQLDQFGLGPDASSKAHCDVAVREHAAATPTGRYLIPVAGPAAALPHRMSETPESPA
ncbi:MAG: hypothetical protein AAFW69_09755 [Pseudomonadota bacterium]